MHEQRFVSTSVDPFTKKLYDRPINGKYVLIERLGKGGFGVVYLAKDIVNDEELALKLEHHSIDRSFLEEEARKYEAFQDAVGLPKAYWFGQHNYFRVMAFEMLAQSPKDDLESLGYMIAFFLLGETAMARLASSRQRRKNRVVMEKKMATSPEQLCEKLPKEFAEYMQEVQDIPNGGRPHYERFRHKFRNLARKEGVKYDNVFDWTIRLFLEPKPAMS
ncbi:casein kinase I [Friedmanniomyces endolithicus]|uniref:Casein kinase I isoform alpha n=1 Tax=Rachicladosporium monterosium TaxID=1507873 RepID=A0ABR0LIT0_9PEZI|nr:casein kinase I [Friedmanniomyces endolithicus]KAK5148523.1 Casein kinase I isoform alpha [Rachicladosporium monterosium]